MGKRDKNGQFRGGKRKGAGRKPKGERAGSPHKRRTAVNPRHPQHVVIRVLGSVGWLRRLDVFRAIRGAITTTLDDQDFRIVHFSVQSNHIHLLCEASSKEALAAGMKGFQVSAAKRINAALTTRTGKERKGQVFADRYHVEAISSVRQTRHALCYVLNNWRKHKRDGSDGGLFDGRLDAYSSAIHFPGWRERTAKELRLPRTYEPPVVAKPKTWLLAESWKLAKPISVFDVPSARH